MSGPAEWKSRTPSLAETNGDHRKDNVYTVIIIGLSDRMPCGTHRASCVACTGTKRAEENLVSCHSRRRMQQRSLARQWMRHKVAIHCRRSVHAACSAFAPWTYFGIGLSTLMYTTRSGSEHQIGFKLLYRGTGHLLSSSPNWALAYYPYSFFHVRLDRRPVFVFIRVHGEWGKPHAFLPPTHRPLAQQTLPFSRFVYNSLSVSFPLEIYDVLLLTCPLVTIA